MTRKPTREFRSTPNPTPLVFGDEPGLVGYWRFDDPATAMPINLSPLGGPTTPFNVDWAPSDAPVCPVPDGGPPPDATAPDGGVAYGPLVVPAEAAPPADGPLDVPTGSVDGAPGGWQRAASCRSRRRTSSA